jgi:N6-L-threonylcarbamoyladenine synthase
MILGIDTSAYVTSIALASGINVYFDERIPLNVEFGKRGLRQSEAVFQHVKNMNSLSRKLKCFNIKGVGVSTKPRDLEDSYMPVFNVGESFANTIANILKVPLIELSHQEGHVYSGIWSKKVKISDILVIHISGGTSDVLQVKNSPFELDIKQLGSGGDLYAGQFVDRVGVALGLSFPAGNELESIAKRINKTEMRIPSSVNNYEMSFSGPESAAQRFIKKDAQPEDLARSVFICIARSLEKVIRHAYSEKEYQGVMLVGGVARNSIIMNELKTRVPYNIIFCDRRYSGDNAVGIALLAQNKIQNL